MATMSSQGIDEFVKKLEQLESGAEEVADKMLIAGANVLKSDLRSAAEAHKDTGAMASSIKVSKVSRKSSNEASISVRPTGKDSKGVRNMEKAGRLEYGTSKQAATPFIQPTVESSEAEVLKTMTEVFDNETGKGFF